MTEPLLSPGDLDVLAAELALGLLDGAEKASALRRELENPAFAAMVGAWRDRGDGWLNHLAPEAVDGNVWSRIQSGLGHDDSSGDVDIRRGAALRNWRRLAMLATAASLVLAAALAMTMVTRDGQISSSKSIPSIANKAGETAVVQIADKAGAPLISAVYHPQSGTLSMRVSDLETPDKAPELWVLDKAGKPHSLGMVEEKGTLSIEISDRLRALLVEGATLAITVEDRAGAPHDAPAGEILGTAKLSTI